MRLAVATVFVVFLVNCCDGNNGKGGNTPRPAIVSYQGCKVNESALKKCASVSNKGIQMGEAWANPRVHGQLFAVFVPNEPGVGNYASEGGPYGYVTAWDCNPLEADLSASDNYANWCMFWDGKDTGRKPTTNCGGTPSPSPGDNTNPSPDNTKPKKPKKPDPKKPDPKKPDPKKPGGGCPNPIPSKVPGEKGLPMPIVCPSNLNPCYSAKFYDPGGPLAKYASMKPTYKGIWFPLKNKATRNPLFCMGLDLGCPTPTMLQLQLHHLPDVGCDVSKCKVPPGAPAPK